MNDSCSHDAMFLNVFYSLSFLSPFIIIVDCVWAEWEEFEKCSKTCGGGSQKRTRVKTAVENYGGTCSGASDEEKDCNTGKCPGKVFSIVFCFYCNNYCKFTQVRVAREIV